MAPSRTRMALAIAALMVVELAMAANHTVGDSDGWELGSNLQSWISSKNFNVGDVIVFVYSANHNVLEVNEADFSSCSASNPIDTHMDGNTAIKLLASGKRYFICGTPGHCLNGMKVEIDTLATSPPPPSSPTAPTSPPMVAPPPNVTPSSPPPKVTPSSPPPKVTPSSPPPTSSPKSPPAKSPAKSPQAPSPGSNASPPAPTIEPTPRSPAPTPESPIPPFPFDMPMIPSAAPTTPPPPLSSAYKCKVHFSVGFSFVVIMLLAL